jgi:hypothetical protein
MKIFEEYLWADFLYCCMILFRFGWFCTILFLVWKREDRPYVTAYVFVIVGRADVEWCRLTGHTRYVRHGSNSRESAALGNSEC